MTRPQQVLVLSCLILTCACPDYPYTPADSIRVLGFATTCDGGSAALLTHTESYDGRPSQMAMEESWVHPVRALLSITPQLGNDSGPFPVEVNGQATCRFETHAPEPLVETNCYMTGDLAPLCQARLNLQGYKAAPPDYERNDVPLGLLYGEYKPVAPQHLFDTADFEEAFAAEKAVSGEPRVYPKERKGRSYRARI